jgi:2-polyprenyl-6-methoxyphenol hydroxylase-like FAD-dependent oxidoreductase
VRTALGIGCRHLAGPEPYVLGTVDVDTGTEELAVYCGPGYADGVVPLPDGTYFWDRVTRANREAVEARDVDGWRAEFAGRVAQGPELAAAVRSWDQLTVVNVRPFWAKRRIAEGVALAGDAAGAVHPHAAQGANLALEDAVALGEALGDASAGSVPEGMLEPYGRERQRRLRRYVLWSIWSARSFDAPNPLWRPGRRIGFALNRIGPLRRRLLEQTAGGRLQSQSAGGE